MQRFLMLTAIVGAHAVDSAHAQTAFLSLVQDVPLAPGLTEDPAGEAAFEEGRGGRVVLARAEGAGAEADVRLFYDAALPALGWSRQDAQSYARGRETLRLAIASPAKDRVAVRFTFVVSAASLQLD